MRVSIDAIEGDFRNLFPTATPRGGIGGLFSRAVAPPGVDRAPSDDEGSLLSLDVLRDGGWVHADDDVLPCLPWLGVASFAEGEPWLTIDGLETVPRLLLQPESGAMFAEARWSADVRMEPGEWLSLTLFLASERRDEEPSRSRALRLGVRRVADEVVVIVVPEEIGLDGRWPQLLSVDATEWSEALDDRISGTLPRF